MADLAERQDITESAVTERDMGKHNNATTGFKALAKKAGAKYGSKAAGERVAGAQFQKMKKAGQLEEGQCSSCDCSPCECVEESALQGYLGKKKYGPEGMKALQKAGREHAGKAKMDKIRNRYDKMDEADSMSLEEQDMEENNAFGGARQAAIEAGKPTFTVGNKTYRVTGDTSNEKQMEEGMDMKGVAYQHGIEDGKAMLANRNNKPRYNKQSDWGENYSDYQRGVRDVHKNAGAESVPFSEGAFKTQDIERQEREMKKSPRGLNQVPGIQKNKPHTKEHPLKNVAKGIKAFVQGKPEPMDEEKEPRSKGTAFDPETRNKMKTDREGTGNFDKKKITTGTVYTRRHKEDDEDEIKSDQPKAKGRPKGPAKGPERVTAKAWKHKDGRQGAKHSIGGKMHEDGIPVTDRGEYDDEVGMAKDQIHTIVRHAQELERALGAGDNLPEWVQEKMGQIKGMMTSVTDYMLSQKERGIEQHTGREGISIAEDVTVSTGAIQELWKLATFLKGYIQDPEGQAAWQEMAQLIKGYKDSQQQNVAEKAVSKSQRKFMGMAHAIQKGEKIKGASPALKKVAKTMKTGDTHDFAVTKEKGLPKKVKKTDEGNDGNLANNAKPYDKVTKGDVIAGRLGKDEMGGKKPKEKKVAETTTSGSVASAPAKTTTSAGGMTFGKGVYEGAVNESYERKLKAVLNEGMNVTVNMNAEGQKSVNVSADGEDAEKLAEILKLAGLGGQSGGCSSCGQSSCGCETVDEAYGDTTASKNNPDWPTDRETTDANDPYLRRLSGGLNGAKSTGQTTIPVIASQARRQVSMEESVKLERSLFNTWKTYKGQ